MAPVAYAVSTDLPSKAELEQIARIRAASTAEIQALSCQADDVVGDLRICRFLRSRYGNVEEATEWFQFFLRWRVSSGMDLDRRQVVGRSPEDLLDWYRKRANPHYPVCPYAGRNQDGHVLWMLGVGKVDPKKFIEHRPIPLEEDRKTFSLLFEWTLWHLNNLSRQEGRMVYCLKVGDFQGLGEEGRKLIIFVPEFKAYMTELFKLMQKVYCEHDSLVVAINAPFAFRLVFPVVKMILTKRQVSKFRVLGDTSQADVRAALKEYVPEHLLLTKYGGQRLEVPGFFPLPSPADVEEWYHNRSFVRVELAPSEIPAPPEAAAPKPEAPEPEAEASPGELAPAGAKAHEALSEGAAEPAGKAQLAIHLDGPEHAGKVGPYGCCWAAA